MGQIKWIFSVGFTDCTVWTTGSIPLSEDAVEAVMHGVWLSYPPSNFKRNYIFENPTGYLFYFTFILLNKNPQFRFLNT